MGSKSRPGISRTIWALIVVFVLALAAGEYALNSESHGESREIDITIVETNPILQIDYFYPDSFSANLNQNVTLAVLNDDDNVRVLTVPAFNINETLSPGEAARVPLLADKAGAFLFYSPKTPPNAVSQGRIGPCLNGTLTITSAAEPAPVANESLFASQLTTLCNA